MSTEIQLFINNQDVPTQEYMEVCDPGRLTDVVGRVAVGTLEHVDQGVRAAHTAFQTWKFTSLSERLEVLRKMIDVLSTNADSFARVLSSENGMLLQVSRSEINLAIHAIEGTIRSAQSFFQSKQLEDAQSWVSVEKRPIGVIAGIVPWNAPLVLTMQKVAPALVCGNTLVMKPSPNAPIGVSIVLQRIASLLPPGVINVIHGGSDVGSALNKHPLVRKISFTGGGSIAKLIMKDAAESIKSVHFELGGNDPAIVLEDVNLDIAVPKIVNAAFRRSGQVCFAVKRVYVHRNIYESFYDRMCELVDAYCIGHQLNNQSTFGPMNNRNQYTYVKGLIENIKESSAKVTVLGQKLEPENWENGYYLQPVVVKDAEPEQEIVTCEQFGPVVPLIPYDTVDHAIEMANHTEYGLGSSVWTEDFEQGLRIARRIEAGMTFINGHGQSELGHEAMPFGGVKQSGIGRENSGIGLAEFIEYHAINYHKSV